METGKETKWRLWQRSKKCCMIFKSGSDAPYTERQYVKYGRTKDLINGLSTLESIAPF